MLLIYLYDALLARLEPGNKQLRRLYTVLPSAAQFAQGATPAAQTRPSGESTRSSTAVSLLSSGCGYCSGRVHTGLQRSHGPKAQL